PRDDAEPGRAVADPDIPRRARLQRERQPDVGRLAGRLAEEAARGHTDDRDGDTLEAERTADGRWGAREAPRPVRIADHGDCLALRPIVRGHERAADRGGDAERREVIAGDPFVIDRLRWAVDRDRIAPD